MKILSSLLDAYRSLRDPRQIREEILSIVNTETKLTLSPEAIEIKNDSVRISCGAVERAVIFMYQQSLEQKIKEKIPKIRAVQFV